MKVLVFVLSLCLTFSPAMGQAWWGGRSYSGRVCNSPNCTMCNSIQSQLFRQRTTVFNRQATSAAVQYIPSPVVSSTSVPTISKDITKPLDASQQKAPEDVVDVALEMLELAPNDVLAEIGCGDGWVLIKAVQDYGCKAVGVEVDKNLARIARQKVLKAERDGLIPVSSVQVVTSDARDFEPDDYGVTAIYSYLYEDLLYQLKDTFETVSRVVTPFHHVPGLKQKKFGDVYLYTASQESFQLTIPEEEYEVTPVAETHWDIIGSEERSQEERTSSDSSTPSDAGWLLSSFSGRPKLDVWFYSQPWCPHCGPEEKFLKSLPWVNLKKRSGNKVPGWVTGYPTIVWKNEAGCWKQLRGWHGQAGTIATIFTENPSLGDSVRVVEDSENEVTTIDFVIAASLE